MGHIVKNNLWNRIFHSSDIKDVKNKITSYNEILSRQEFIYNVLDECKTLRDLVTFHVYIWNLGIRHENLAPSKHGYFRTALISYMTPNEVYLPDVNYLGSRDIDTWESSLAVGSEEYKVLYNRYLDLLTSCLKSELRRMRDYILESQLGGF